jgi:hypothetical protein
MGFFEKRFSLRRRSARKYWKRAGQCERQGDIDGAIACLDEAIRRIAVYWLQGDDPTYSNVAPSTLLSAC